MVSDIEFLCDSDVSSENINSLMAAAWADYSDSDWESVLSRSLGFVCAYLEGDLVGFVNVAWNGGNHAFLLDTTVHPSVQRRGIGLELVQKAVKISRDKGIEWLHVDFESKYAEFYQRCGFKHSEAGLINNFD